jgi:hypothetical protein
MGFFIVNEPVCLVKVSEFSRKVRPIY